MWTHRVYLEFIYKGYNNSAHVLALIPLFIKGSF